ncbi:dipeptide/oligopeptide/nickel ABC transporter permease/ATP-binding protein [Microbacterium dauci]|uniref:Dipeptide/oligopeptide/nickel ABC transporter permease/ATP-binding protein n=1 Tax=Microbacterium dauci TaxID=3048008 RepID=A0ABT6ZDC0_9MICO|nr:dipeptide/oligopeptide/nickel ABC transporter permease/ATP-binding protein [Microbacterium sp. LX3-4]MDJ1114159.1 dipeptide/oligopeptide/nickel ABC transporter permease/ATP-binding protein [Microbacterium sp. LX3-4]
MSSPDPGSIALDNSAPASLRRLRRFARNPLGVGSAVILLAITLSAVFAPVLAPHDPNLIVLSNTLLGPSADHLLGTDASGRDVFSRLLYGGQVSLMAGVIMITTAVAVGVPLGLLAGYYAKWIDSLSSWVANLLMSLPEILIIIVVITSLGSGLAPTMVTLGILASPDLFRLTRSVVVNVRSELYVDAARVSGLGDGRIIFRHVLGVVVGPVLVRASFVFGMAIIVQSGLEFLGFGDPSRPSWGGMLSEAFQTIYRAPELVFAPGAAIGITVISLAVLGTAIADALGTDRSIAPRLRSRKTSGAAATSATGSANGSATADQRPSANEHARATTQPGPADAGLLRVHDMRVVYPTGDGGEKVVVSGASLHVDRGEVLGLVGESGSGKSQLSFGILGLLSPEAVTSATSVTLDGQSLLGRSARSLQGLRGTTIAYVPQEPMSNLDPSFTVGSQLIRPMRHNLGISRREAHERAIALLDRVGIPDPARTMKAYPHELSGGMAQRVLIAGAVSCDPELLIADEPTTALDVTVQAGVLRLLRELQRERNMGLILVTHDLGVVADICDRVAVMSAGEIVETRPVAELFAAPEHPYTRKLLSSTLEDAPPRAERTTAGRTS